MAKLGLHVFEFPSGMWGFVGNVPAELSYVTKQGGPISAQDIERQLRLPANMRIMKTRVWRSKEEAVKEANAAGYLVHNV